jgi:hypothetical protein
MTTQPSKETTPIDPTPAPKAAALKAPAKAQATPSAQARPAAPRAKATPMSPKEEGFKKAWQFLSNKLGISGKVILLLVAIGILAEIIKKL